MPDFTDAEMDAREAGSEAYELGKKRTDNPHSLLSAKNLWQCWDDGWEEAKDEDEEGENDE